MRLAPIVLAAALLGPATAVAADSRPPKDELAVTLSRFVLTEESWNKMQAASAAQLRQYIEGSLRASGAEIPAGFADRFAAAFAKMISYGELIDLQAGLLAKYFSAGEMKELLAFYKTPLGQKMIGVMPEVTQDVNGQMLAILQQRLPALMEALKADLEAGKGASK